MATDDISIVENVNECILQFGEYSESFLSTLPALGKEAVLQWCMKEGFIGSSYACPKCGKNMKLRERKGKKAVNDGFEWVCRNQSIAKEKRHNVCRSVRKGSWFVMSNLDMCTVLLVIRKWYEKCSEKKAIEDLNVSNHTIIDWYNFCREVCFHVLVRDSYKIGGVNKIVEVAESKFGKMKFGRGKHVKEGWVYGGIERDTHKCFFRVVPNRTSAYFVDVIAEWVLPGTTIISNCSATYKYPKDEGFQHLEKHHSFTFVFHTNTIDGMWARIKKRLRNSAANKTGGIFDSYLYEFMWRKRHEHSLENEIFKSFLADIASIYPPILHDPTADEEFCHNSDEDTILGIDMPVLSSS